MSESTPTVTPTFRLGTPADAAPLTHLINTAFRNDNTTQVFLSPDHAGIDVTSTASLTASIANPNVAIIVATYPNPNPNTNEDNTLLVAHCSVRQTDNPNIAWLGLLAVDIQHQNQGLGRQMVEYVEAYAKREWGVGRMEFDVVNTRSELRAWYGKRGYVDTGETRPFPYEYHGEEGEGVLRAGLEFVVMGRDL